MAEVKYSLDDNAKQNFLEPLHHLQMKDLKEVMVCFFWLVFVNLVLISIITTGVNLENVSAY